MLIYGQLPSKSQMLAFESRIRVCYPLDLKLLGFIQTYQQEELRQSNMMSMLQNLISCLSVCHPEPNPSYLGGPMIY